MLLWKTPDGSPTRLAGRRRFSRRNQTPGKIPHLTELKGATTCCSGYANADCSILSNSQSVPFGTPAYQASHGRRQRIESINSSVRSRNNFKTGWCRTFGLVPNTIASILAAVWRNIEITREQRAIEREQAAERRQVKLAATGGAQDGDPGADEASTDAEPGDDNGDEAERIARPPP